MASISSYEIIAPGSMALIFYVLVVYDLSTEMATDFIYGVPEPGASTWSLYPQGQSMLAAWQGSRSRPARPCPRAETTPQRRAIPSV